MGRRKRKSELQHSSCSICECHYPHRSSASFIPRCSSHIVFPRHTICDSCLYKHIFTTISQDITNRVICPVQGCNAKITNDTVQPILFAFNRHDLWEDYALKSSWHGTSEQWIKRFTARCPGCRVPIEKNGGCNQVVCKRCHLVFNWKRAKDSNLYKIWTWLKTSVSLLRALFYICLTMAFIFLLLKLFSFYKEK